MKNKDYIIYIDKVKTSVIRVPAKNKKEYCRKVYWWFRWFKYQY